LLFKNLKGFWCRGRDFPHKGFERAIGPAFHRQPGFRLNGLQPGALPD